MEESNQIDALFPAAATIKKRRIEVTRVREAASQSVEPEPVGDASANKPKGTAKEIFEGLRKAKKKASEKEKGINLVELARVRREAEEEAARLDAEAVRNAMAGVDISELRNLATIEEMELPVRTERSSRREAAIDPRWDPSWNGRKNFKGFRRNQLSDGRTGALRTAQKIFVPLEEVSRRRNPVGEDYFLESSARSGDQTRDSQRSGRSSRPALGRVAEDPDASSAPKILKRREALIAKRAVEAAREDQDAQMSDVVEDSMCRDSPADTVRETQREQVLQKGKRPAPAGAGNLLPVKKIRGELANGEDTGFRFRRRKL
jgi:hypothetical protein